MTATGARQRAEPAPMRRLALVFVALIVYGSLFPFSDWRPPSFHLLSFLTNPPAHIGKADAIQNILAYIPLGLFLGAWLLRTGGAPHALLWSTLIGTALSFSMEYIQQYLPSRDPSLVDLVLNAGGTFGGAVLASFLRGHSAVGERLLAIRDAWLERGTLPNLGLAALALWVLAQTSPLVPSLDLGQLRSGLSQVLLAILHPGQVALAPAATYALYLAGLGLLARRVARAEHSSFKLFGALVACVFVLKVIVVGRQLSGEALLGAAAAFAFLALWDGGRAPRNAAWCAMALVAAGFVVSELTPGRDDLRSFAFNWIPLAGQMQSLTGLQNILELVWPFFAIACFARGLCPFYRRQMLAITGGAAILLSVFALEWLQQDLPGRFGDITQVLLAWTGWMLPWSFSGADYAVAPAGRTAMAGRAGTPQSSKVR